MLDQPEFGTDCTQIASITICNIVLIFISRIFVLVLVFCVSSIVACNSPIKIVTLLIISIRRQTLKNILCYIRNSKE